MKRAIQRLIQDPLALKILDGEVHAGRRRAGGRGSEDGDEMKFDNSETAEGRRRLIVRRQRLEEPSMKTLKTAFLLTALTLLLLVVGQRFGGRAADDRAGLRRAHERRRLLLLGQDRAGVQRRAAHQPRARSPRLYAVMERLAAKANLPMPKLYMIPQAAPNAFATGRNPSHASVAVTQGLMELMNDDELEGVIAHELSHVRNYDILTSSIAATIAGAITWVARMGRWG